MAGMDSYIVDALTRVYKKEYFYEEARKLIDANPSQTFAVMEIDINCLTMINDMYGLLEGDRLLSYMGDTLRKTFDGIGMTLAARIHADLFVCFFPYTEEAANRYINTIEEEMQKFGNQISVDLLLSFGIYIIDAVDIKVSTMCERANLALKTVKGNYIKHVAYFDAKMHRKALQEVDITSRMSRALRDREFTVFYQPKHSLDDERVIGAEALVRWVTQDKGMVSPGVFVPIFENNGFIMKLDAYVWEETCRFIHEKNAQGIKVPPISVNVSRVDLFNPDIVEVIIGLIKKYEIDPKMLKLEFTESAYTESEQLMLNVMDQLHDQGLEIDMDDFGSGYSSLNMLKDVPVDGIKIDLRFLSKTKNEIKGRRILSSVIHMSKWLGIPAIVEGVETKEQIDLLKSYGCTSVQGFYYAKPMPEEEFVAYLQEHEAVVPVTKPLTVNDKVMEPEAWWDNVSADCEPVLEMHDGYVICELGEDGELHLMRASDSYYETFVTTRESMFRGDMDMKSFVVPEFLDLFMDTFKQAKGYHTVSQCVFQSYSGQGIKWIHAKIRLISRNEGTNLYFCIVDDMTDCMPKA